MERVATDIYTFSRLREDGFTYVDKTDALYAMASGEKRTIVEERVETV